MTLDTSVLFESPLFLHSCIPIIMRTFHTVSLHKIFLELSYWDCCLLWITDGKVQLDTYLNGLRGRFDIYVHKMASRRASAGYNSL